ncbi:MAG: hypothetical protein ACREEL_12080 [Stellaceae bacterium]
MMTSEQREARYERTIQEHQHHTLISKLRWMGLEQEADRMTAASDTPAAITVPEETD